MLHAWLKWRIIISILFIIILVTVNGMSNTEGEITTQQMNNNNKIENHDAAITDPGEDETEEDNEDIKEGTNEDDVFKEYDNNKEIVNNKDGNNNDNINNNPPPHDDRRECVSVGRCSKCEDFERDADYCARTGSRMELSCYPVSDPTKKETKYESCHGEAETRGVYLYEALTFAFFILSCYAVRVRRAKLVQQQQEKIAKQIGSV